MSELTKQILNLLLKKLSIKQISQKMNITEKEVYINIKEIIKSGKNIVPNYYYDSNIRYELGKEKENQIEIKLNKMDNQFRTLVVSDLHIGDSKADINLMNYVYEYAAKNGIKNILNCGDLIEGIYTSGSKNIKTVEEQIDTVINQHPFDKNINVFGVLGNHDFHSYYYDKIDIAKLVHDERYDINFIGYGKGLIKVGMDNILLSHKIRKKNVPEIKENYRIQLIGHGHEMKTKAYDVFKLCIPTLSYISPDSKNKVLPGFMDLRIELEKNHFEYLESKHMLVLDEVIEVSKSSCRLKTLYYKKR